MPCAFAVVAHPDDVEFFMSGTLMLLGQAGYELHYMTVANGSVGTTEVDADTIVSIRREESRRAAEMIGATYHHSLTNDIDIFYDRPTLARMAAIMRDVKPDILLVHSPDDYMEDHMNACRLAVTGAFCRGMRNFPTQPPRPPIEGEVTIYHAQPHGNCSPLCEPVVPHLYVNVGSVMERKREMLACHVSQKAWLDASQGMDSYLDSMQEFAREVGRLSGRFVFAEGWRRHNHLGFCGAGADPLSAALGELVYANGRTK
jgi:LmbE family N-acetylglucosaminyl deacetylase